MPSGPAGVEAPARPVLARRRRGRYERPSPHPRSPVMIAILVVAVFVISFGALNFFEFGRVD